jgi:hypothetical protein
MPSEDHLQTLAYQSTSLRNDVNDLERQMMQLQGRLNLAKAESQAKDKCASLTYCRCYVIDGM